MSTAMVKREKHVALGYLLMLPGFFGIFGLHRFYAGRWLSGAIWLVTMGFCGIGQLVDLVFVPRMISDANEGKPVW